MKYDLSDTTFLLLARIDSIERLENLLGVTKFLTKNLCTNIHLLESDRRNRKILNKILPRNINYFFFEDYDPILYRTRLLNYMMKKVETPFVGVWDIDVIVPIRQIVNSIELLRNDKYDFIYPYKEDFLNVPQIIKDFFFNKLDIKILQRNKTKMTKLYQPDPVGGAFLCSTNSYRNSGLENESFYGWGIEDGERFMRWKRLGYRIHQLEGELFHLCHTRGINSSDEYQNKMEKTLKLRELIASFRITEQNSPIKYESIDYKNN